MKLYTNRYDKNSIIDKTSYDEEVSGVQGKYTQYFIYVKGKKIEVFQEWDVLNHQLYLHGKPLEDSAIINTHFVKNGNHYVYVNDVKTPVLTHRQIRGRNSKYREEIAAVNAFQIVESSSLVQETTPAKRHKPNAAINMSSSSSTAQFTDPTTGYVPNISFFQPGTAANANLNATRSEQRSNDINNNNNAGIANASLNSLLTQSTAFVQPRLFSPEETARSNVELFINGLATETDINNNNNEPAEYTASFDRMI